MSFEGDKVAELRRLREMLVEIMESSAFVSGSRPGSGSVFFKIRFTQSGFQALRERGLGQFLKVPVFVIHLIPRVGCISLRSLHRIRS